ncbi:MAG: CDP-alcohol phosphatidyltransferase family protein [Endomicrobia bacterium]|nr:CDP-alcohol phosphatidyltransferase family protein [Endomicrobiia bacterium]
MNIAIKITIFRMLLTPIFLIFILIDNMLFRLLALLVFITGGISDTVDGIVARKNKITTKLGSSLDPLADKILITTAFISFLGFYELNIPVWTVAVIIIRDYVITWLRSIDEASSIPADKTAKIKTFMQNIVIITIILILAFKDYILDLNIWKSHLYIYPKLSMIVVSSFTFISGVIYFLKYKKLLLKQFEKV